MTDANQRKADVGKDYIEWAIGKGYAVIDVNIPKHVTTEPVSVSFAGCEEGCVVLTGIAVGLQVRG